MLPFAALNVTFGDKCHNLALEPTMSESLTPTYEATSESKVLGSLFHFALIPLRGMTPEGALEAYKERYPRADHVPYAYVLGEKKRYSDDGEPHGAAGMAYLDLLESRHIDEALLICARYFGGSKLGLGRLKKTFRDGALEVLAKARFLRIAEAEHFKTYVPFEKLALAEGLLRKQGVSYEKEEESMGASLIFAPGSSNIISVFADLGLRPMSMGNRKAYLDD